MTHTYDDDAGLLRGEIDSTISVLTEPGMTLNVVDHLASPPIASGGWEPWATSLAVVACHPRVKTIVSGLATRSSHDVWSWRDWAPYADHALPVFGSERLVIGSGGPVSILNADSLTTIAAFREPAAMRTFARQDDLFFRAAHRVYGVPLLRWNIA